MFSRVSFFRLVFPCLLIGGCLWAPLASATYISTVIVGVQMDENNGMRLYVKPGGAITLAGCQTNAQWPFVVDVSTDFGKRLQNLIMIAYATKSNVVLRGTDTCLVHSGVETIYRVELY